jgi:hypothetical protein
MKTASKRGAETRIRSMMATILALMMVIVLAGTGLPQV